ncbi:MAG: esterase/lipase family protein [Gammaproteobacteria bacterium]
MTNNTEAVVLIHGLFMNGWDMSLLRSRISDGGFYTHQFSYHSTSTNIDQITSELHKLTESIQADKIHYVGHSLGGLVIRHFLESYPSTPKGRVVTLGSPHNGSNVAHFLNCYDFTSKILGESLNTGLLGNAPPWSGSRELGSIAGNVGFGMGFIFPDLKEPNDGTVSVEETELENMTEHIQVPTSHTGLLLSKIVADHALNFLKQGKFADNNQ